MRDWKTRSAAYLLIYDRNPSMSFEVVRQSFLSDQLKYYRARVEARYHEKSDEEMSQIEPKYLVDWAYEIYNKELQRRKSLVDDKRDNNDINIIESSTDNVTSK